MHDLKLNLHLPLLYGIIINTSDLKYQSDYFLRKERKRDALEIPPATDS